MKYAGFIIIATLVFTSQLFGGDLTVLKMVPEISSVAGTYTSFQLRFVTDPTGDGLPLGGKIRIDFPAGFNCDKAIIGTFMDDSTVSTLDGGLIPQWHQGTTLVMIRDSTGTDISQGDTVHLAFGNVLLPGTPGNYTFNVQTKWYDGYPGGSSVIDEATGAGPIKVTSGLFHHFGITGYPQTTLAGANFTNNVTVSARDVNNNIIADYTGTMFFGSTDPNATLPYTAAAPYNFIPADGGQKAFAGAGFALKNAGNQLLYAIEQSTSDTSASNSISVQPGPIASFNFSVGATQTAGTAFTVTINNAVDAEGNNASGKKILMSSDNANNSPNGQPPTFNDILIGPDGSGSAKQTLVKAESGITLKGTAEEGSFTKTTSAITINPGTVVGSIKILWGTSGATGEVGAFSIKAAADTTVHTSGYDLWGNYIGDVSSDWSVAGGIGSVNPATNSDTTRFVGGAEGVGNIVATAGSASDETGLINVTSSDLTLAYIKIRNAAGGVGEVMDVDYNMTADETITLFAASYNAGGMYLGDVVTEWSLYTGNLEPAQQINVTADRVVFSPTTAMADGSVNGRISAKKGFIDDQTGKITVYPGAFDRLTIMKFVGGQRVELKDDTLTIEQKREVFAYGFDADNNPLGQVDAKWSLSSGSANGYMNPASPTPAKKSTFYPQKVGYSIIRATSATHPNKYDDSGIINIKAGTPHHLLISTESEARGLKIKYDTTITITSDDILRLWAAAVDSLDNYAGQASPKWGIIGNLDATFDTSNTHQYIDFNPKVAGSSGRIYIKHKTGLFPGDTTGTIQVIPGEKHHLRVALGASGNTEELGDTTLTVGDSLDIHASAFDADDNYTGDAPSNIVSWHVLGLIGEVKAGNAPGKFKFYATRSGQGLIRVNGIGLLEGYSGNITVQKGEIHHVLIRDKPDGKGEKVSSKSITIDDTLKLYAAAYDIGETYLGPALASWKSDSTGTLDPPINLESSEALFYIPNKPGNGKIFIAYPYKGSVLRDTVHTIQVQPGEPFGSIILTPDRKQIPADDTTTVKITSEKIRDRRGNQVIPGFEFTVKTTVGTIKTLDVNPVVPDTQVAVNANGIIQFELKASSGGGTATVTAAGGSAQGITTISISNINLISVSTPFESVSRGQTGIPIRMVVENLGDSEMTITSAGLQFIGSGGENRYGEYRDSLLTPLPTLAGGQTATLMYNVDVLEDAALDTVKIDGKIETNIPGLDAPQASNPDFWKVQNPPSLEIIKVEALEDTVSQGARGLDVSMRIRNNSGLHGATAVIDTARPTFWLYAENVTSQYTSAFSGDAPRELAADSEATINFKVNVHNGAFEGNVSINGEISARDANSGVKIRDDHADTTDSWQVEKAAQVQITAFRTSQSTVTKNQTNPWYAILTIENKGNNLVELDSCQLYIYKLNENITHQYTIVRPDRFASGFEVIEEESEDSLKIEVSKTGPATGSITLKAVVYLSDFGKGGNQLVDRRETQILVQEPANLTVLGASPKYYEATRRQSRDWYIGVAMQNFGGSDIRIDTTHTNTYVRFSSGTDFVVNPPRFKKSNTTRLKSGGQDTLLFPVDSTGAILGLSRITINMTAVEANSGNKLIFVDTTASVKIQSEPTIRIKNVVNSARNADFVNRKQNFNLTVFLDNAGGITADEVDSVWVEVTSNLQPGVVWKNVYNGVKPIVDNPLIFPISAADSVNITELYTANIISAKANNSAEEIMPGSPVIGNKAKAKLEEPANLKVLKFITPDTIQARQYLPWPVRLVVRNVGQAKVKFNKPTKNDLIFKVAEVQQLDYEIGPSETLNGGDLLVEPNAIDTLTYWITQTGKQAGEVTANLQITPTDLNDPAHEFSINRKDTIYVETAAKIRISNIVPVCYVSGNVGQVNVGQNFKIRVTIENGGAERADSVWIKLETFDTSYVAFDNTQMLNYVGIAQSADLDFDVKAKKFSSENIEFTARIISAKGHITGLPVPIDKSGIQSAYVKIHEPSKLTLTLKTPNGLSAFAIDQEFTLTAVVTRTGTSRLDHAGKLALEVPNGYQINSPDTVDFIISDNRGDAEWKIRTPSSAAAPAAVRVKMIARPTDRNTGGPVAVENLNAQLSIETVESSLRIGSVQIIEPEGATDGIVSSEQFFKVEATVNYSDNVTKLKAVLNLPDTDANNSYFISAIDSSQVNKNPARWIWTVKAPNDHVDMKYFVIRVTGTEKTPDDVADEKKLEVTTVERAALALDINSSVGEVNPLLRLSVDQSFTLSVSVKNKGSANTKGTGVLTLDLGTTTGITTDEALEKTFEVNKTVTWNLKAPKVTKEAEYITVKMDSLPVDENRSEPAYADERERQILVETVDKGAVQVDSIGIVWPFGAQDHELSTEQIFKVKAFFNWVDIRNIQAEIKYPSQYFNCAINPKQPSNSKVITGKGSVEFTVEALSKAVLQESIKVVVYGQDAQDAGTTIRDTSKALKLDLIERAVAHIQAGTDNENGVVSVGQYFRVKAMIINRKAAALQGDFTAELVLPPEFAIDSPIQQTRAYNENMEWWVYAPYEPLAAKKFTVNVLSWPNDENTNSPAYHPNAFKEFNVITEEKSVVVTKRANLTPRSISKGEKNVPMLGLVFKNSGSASSNKLLLKGMKIKLKNRQGDEFPDPAKVITRIVAVHGGNSNLVYGVIEPVTSKNPVDLQFTRIDTIKPGILDSLNVLVDINPQAEDLNFKLSIDTTAALNLVDIYSGRRPKFENQDGTELTRLELNSDLSVVLNADLESSFLNYPNPFGRHGTERTKFIYYLDADSDVELRIFTLLGDLVWSIKFTRDEPEGAAGMHEENYLATGGPPIWWGGENNEGSKVLNGVYIAVFITSNGKQATTKVAVLK